MSDLAQQIQRLNDLEAIRDLARRYAHLIWQNRPLETVDLFTEDGVVDFGPDGGRIEGRAALQAIYQQKVDDLLLHPFVHNHIIDLAGDRAEGMVYVDLRCVRDGESLMGSGFYEDRYQRVEGQWKFSHRLLRMNYLVPPTAGWR